MFTPGSGSKNLCKICQLIENYGADIENIESAAIFP